MAKSRTRLIAGNWKMHNNVQQSSLLVHRLEKRLETLEGERDVEVAVFPGFVSLQPIAHQVAKSGSGIKVGAQNMYEQDEGTFTGEVSGSMLSGIADYVLIGHSERRIHMHENDRQLAHKMAAAVRHGLNPILCVGETLIDRHDGHTNAVLHAQVVSNLSFLTNTEVTDHVTIAYEPVWAISSGDGNGKPALPEDAAKAAQKIRQDVEEMFGTKAARSVRVLYGGSAKPDNAKAFLDAKGVDGLLVGGASLNYQQFSDIVKEAKKG